MRVILKQIIPMRTVGEITKGKEFYSIASDQPVVEAALQMAEKDIGAVPVLQDNRLVGIFSERDVIKRIVAAGHDPRTTLVSEVMTREIIVADENDTVQQVLSLMQTNRCRHMPVVRGDRVLGFLSLRDLLFADVEEKGTQILELQTYLYYSPENQL